MKKSNVVPKIAVFAVFLIVAIIISAPVFSVMFNRILGGGTLNFNEVTAVEFRTNRPIEGELYNIIGCAENDSGEDSDFTLKNGAYYYLVTVGGNPIDKDNPQKLVLVKCPGSSDNYELFNNLWRASSKGDAAEAVELSGVLKKNTSAEESVSSKLRESTNIGDLEITEYYIDTAKSVSSISARFYISLIFYACAAVALVLVVQGFKKNRDIDNIEHERSIYRIAQERKSGNKNDDGTDAMFGDSERLLDERPQNQGEAYSAPSRPTQPQDQFQGSAQDDRFDDGFFTSSSSNDSGNEYDGFFGG